MAGGGAMRLRGRKTVVLPDQTVTIGTTDDQVVDISDWLDTVPDDQMITLAVTGAASCQVWPTPLWDLQTTGQSKTWVRRELRNMLRVQTTAAAQGSALWMFSAPGAANYRVAFIIQTAPITAIEVSSLTWAGMGGYPLSRIGSATDWAVSVADPTGAYGLWDGTDATSARIAPAGTYLAAPTVTQVAGDTYTVTVSSTSLGGSWQITLTATAAFIDIMACPARDSGTTPFNQFGKVILSGDRTGNLYWGTTIIVREGSFNPTGAFNIQYSSMKQPTQAVGGPPVPAAFYGTAAAPSWEYADGPNPGWITIMGDPAKPYLAKMPRNYFDVTSRTSQFLGFWFSGIDLNLTAALPGLSFNLVSMRLLDSGGTTRGANGLVIDHCWEPIFSSEEAGYSQMQAVTYNDMNQLRCPSYQRAQGPFLSGYDMQYVGNVHVNFLGDVIGGGIYLESVEGSGSCKVDWNTLLDKKTYPGVHSDFWQVNCTSSIQAPYNAIAAGGYANIQSFVGNLCLKRKGELLGIDHPIGFHLVVVATSSISGTFQVGEVIRNAGSTIRATIQSAATTSGSNTLYPCILTTPADGTSSFPVSITVTGETSGATATTALSTEAAAGNGWVGFHGTVIPYSGNLGMTLDDCQGFFSGSPGPAPIATASKSRDDITHKYLFAGNYVEGMSGQGIVRLPIADATTVICNNATVVPWGIFDGSSYYAAGPISTLWLSPQGSVQVGESGTLVVRNFFHAQPSGFGTAPVTEDNVYSADFGNPGARPTAVPAAVLAAHVDPTVTVWTDFRDFLAGWQPSVGSVLRSQGTNLIFGPFDVEDGSGNSVIDFRRHVYDAAALAAYP